MGLRAIPPPVNYVGFSIARIGFIAAWEFTWCKRYYPKKYTISGLYKPGYVVYDPSVGDWVPYGLNDFAVNSDGGCLENPYYTAISAGAVLVFYYHAQALSGWAGNPSGIIIPSNSWVIYLNNGSSIETVAYAVGSRWNPPKGGYTTVNQWAGSASVR
jgi:hypothetical protein